MAFDATEACDILRRGKTTIDVALALGVSHAHLVRHLYRSSPESRYRQFTLPKRSGGERLICAPVDQIRYMQRLVGKIIDSAYDPPPAAEGFIKGRSICSNARRHVRARWVLNIDLADFFGAVNFGRVRGIFLAPPFEFCEKVATCLASLCTYQGVLPQGAPTSPRLANLVCRGLDREMRKLAFAHGCRYSRYADDITISTRKQRFPRRLAARRSDGVTIVRSEITTMVSRHGFILKESKSRLLSQQNRQEVTGLVVNRKLNVSREYVRGLRALLHAWRTKTPEALDAWLRRHRPPKSGQPVPEVKSIAAGMLGFISMVRGPSDRLVRGLHRLQARAAGAPIDEDAVWVVYAESNQGTGFLLESVGFLTVSHVLVNDEEGLLPAVAKDARELREYALTPMHRSEHLDLALCEMSESSARHHLQVSHRNPQVGDRVTLLGFPRHTPGRTIRREQGTIAALMTHSGVVRYSVTCAIITGNSGGPVLDEDGRVIGVACFGAYGREDANGENRFVSIQHLEHLREFGPDGARLGPSGV